MKSSAPPSLARPARRGALAAPLAMGLALLLSFPLPGRADESQDQPDNPSNLANLSLDQLAHVEVTTASKEPEEVWRTPAAIYVLTQEDIRRSGATSIPEVLRLVPGVEVAQIDSDNWSVGIRGFGSQFSKSVLVLIDGRSVYTPLFAGVYWDVQNVLVEDIDRVEVIRGPGGTIWGANAVNGVINIITKSAKKTQGALVTLGGGNVDQGTGASRLGGSLVSGLDYRVYGMGFMRGPEYHPGEPNFDDWKLGQVGFRTDWDANTRDDLTLQGDLYKGGVGQEVAVATFSPPAQNVINATDDVSGGNLLARWRRDLGQGSDVQLQAYFDRTNRFTPQGGETRNTFDVDFIHHMTLARRQDFIWGLGARLSPADFIQSAASVDFLPNRQTDSIYSGFIQDEIPIVQDRLFFTLGTKLEHNNYTGFEYQPSGRLLWTFSDHQSLWTAVTRAVRTPSRLDDDLEISGYAGESVALTPTLDLPLFVQVDGNPKFNSERVVAYEAGYRSLITSKLYLDVATFFNDYNDLSSLGTGAYSIDTAPGVAGAPPVTYLLYSVPYINGVRGTTDGVELAPDWKPTDWWQLKGSYSYLHMGLQDKPGAVPGSNIAIEGSSPQHEVVVQSLFDFGKRFELDPTYRYVSALPAQFVSSYSTADLRFGWRVNRTVEFSVKGQNLVQPEHAEFGISPGEIVGIRRSVYAKITWQR